MPTPNSDSEDIQLRIHAYLRTSFYVTLRIASFPLEENKSAEAGVLVENHTRSSVLSGGGSGGQREVQMRMRDGEEGREESDNFHPIWLSRYKTSSIFATPIFQVRKQAQRHH